MSECKTNHLIQVAFWESESRAIVVLRDDWKAKGGAPPLFSGPKQVPFAKVEMVRWADVARLTGYCIRDGKVVFLFDPKEEHHRLANDDSVYVAGAFNGWNPGGGPDWRLVPKTVDGKRLKILDVPVEAVFGKEDSDHEHPDALSFKFRTESGLWLPVSGSAPNLVHDDSGNANYELRRNQTGRHIFYVEVSRNYEPTLDDIVVWDDGTVLETHPLPYLSWLLHLGSSLRLGSWIEEGRTWFRVFAPRATHVEARYSPAVDGEKQTAILNRLDDGVWEGVVGEPLAGWYYSYHVDGQNLDGSTQFSSKFPILDPYAVATVGPKGPGIILEPERLSHVPGSERFRPPDWHDLVILECHLADLVSDSHYKKAADALPRYEHMSAMLRDETSYLRTLGINAIELQPLQQSDKANPEDYHWGYMTTNYFAPECSYASDPLRATQVEEFRDVVRAAHEGGIAVILDVVYNHVGEPAHLIFLDKYYFFELDPHLNQMNWSGCGNDLRASAPMGRRLIIESLLHLVRVFDVDGFRFDLAELLGIDVLLDIVAALKAEKPSLILIAEPWSFRGHIGRELKETPYASWNDGYRDFLKHFVRGDGDCDRLRYYLSGSRDHIASWPAQSVNYTESHDDRTWLDSITENEGHNGFHPHDRDRRRTHLMVAILMMSYGIPMLSAGQDFLRSKHGESNTYQRPDLNALHEDRLLYHTHTHEYFRRWIAFRNGPWGGRMLRLRSFPDDSFLRFYFAEGGNAFLALYNAEKSHGSGQMLFGVNPHLEPMPVRAPEFSIDGFCQIADTERLETGGLASARLRWEEGGCTLPGLSCALWVRD